jgi:hypothetical protein
MESWWQGAVAVLQQGWRRWRVMVGSGGGGRQRAAAHLLRRQWGKSAAVAADGGKRRRRQRRRQWAAGSGGRKRQVGWWWHRYYFVYAPILILEGWQEGENSDVCRAPSTLDNMHTFYALCSAKILLSAKR